MPPVTNILVDTLTLRECLLRNLTISTAFETA